MKKGVPKNCAELKGKSKRQSLVFNKVTGLRPTTLLKKRLWHRRFPVNFAKILKTPFLKNTFGRLLLDVVPVHKKKEKTDNANYRLVSILPKLPKIYEKVMYQQFYDHFDSILSPKQCGFRKSHSDREIQKIKK